jgi:hypothetical protein
MPKSQGSEVGSRPHDPMMAPSTALEQDMQRRREEAEIQRELRHVPEEERTARRRWWRFWRR